MRRCGLVVAVFMLAIAVGGCGGEKDASTASSEPIATATGAATSASAATGEAWTEQDLAFVVGDNELHGVVTAPTSAGRIRRW